MTKSDTFPIPRMDDCIDRIGRAKSSLTYSRDFGKYHLMTVLKKSQPLLLLMDCFNIKLPHLEWKNSPATFQRLINDVIAGLDGCEAYIKVHLTPKIVFR